MAALCSWHEQHEPALHELERRLDAEEILVAAAPALVETYAVLTRLPPPHRLSPAVAGELIARNFLRGGVEIVALDANAYRQLLTSAPHLRIAGGRVYDAVILACARIGGVSALLTFNERQFRSLTDEEIEVVVPS